MKNITKLSFIPIALFLVITFGVKSSFAFLNIKLNNINYNPVPIVFIPFISDKHSQEYAKVLNETIEQDLQKSLVFTPSVQPPPYFLALKTNLLNTKHVLDNYMNFNLILMGKVTYNNGVYKIEYILWDVFGHKIIVAKGFNLKKPLYDDIYYTAHHISNTIYKKIVGEEGFFNTKIAFTARKKVYIMNYDGRNKTPITDGTHDVFTPEFSYDGRYVAYVALIKGMSTIYIYDTKTKLTHELGEFKNMVLAPRFSPDGADMMFAISKNGSTNIFDVNLKSKQVKQLTYSYSINIPGSYSPNGDKIVFMSDRNLGRPQIYIMNKDGSNVSRISDISGRYYTPRWSPRGDLIAFTKIIKHDFYIGIMGVDGNHEQIIAKDPFSEGPAWMSNGRSLVYQYMYDQNKGLYAFNMVDLSTGDKEELKYFNNIRDPSISKNYTNNLVLKSEFNLK